MTTNFHGLKIESCFRKLETSADGLSSKEAQKRIKKYGLNELAKEKPLGSFVILLGQFKSPLIYILLIAGVISALLKSYADAAIIFGAVLINTLIGFFQENKANKSLSKLKKLIEHKAIVLRDGKKIEINSSQLTIGDVIVLQAGNRIPADGRLIEAINLQINEASLTGESMPSSKNIDKISEGVALADRENMIYAGTVIVSGIGRAVITAVGKETEIGRIAELVSATPEEKTPLQLRLANFSRFLGLVLGAISLLIVAVGVWQGRSLFEMFVMGVALAVASIPEGLAVAITVILVLGMQQILKHKALVRKLVAAETLGSTTVICSDKTGTLTEGRMSVAHIVIGEKEFELSSLGSRQDKEEAKIVSLALQTAMMCNDAEIENPEEELASWRIIGTPTETALLAAAVQSGLNRRKLLKAEPRIDELPFNSESKYMISLHERKDRGYVLYEKGAPEKLLDKSIGFYHQGGIHKLTEGEKKKLEKTYESLTNKGLRVIGVALREFKDLEWPAENKIKNWGTIDKNLVFVGFIALKDPLRLEAKETIKVCRQAGIRPIIITGDHQLTTRAIAAEIGLKVKADNILLGEELDKISDDKLKHLVKKIDIYARVSPRHKLRIVKALQERGEVVAMTGDGINDSPALKAADIGLSLGTGTDIAKEASDIVLLDNNFKTIVTAVKQGRIIFSNIRKVITYLISNSFSEMILVVGSLLLGMPLAILPAQILWVNIVNDGLPDFALAFEKEDEGIMRREPIGKNEPILDKEMKIIIFAAGIIRDFFIFAVFIYLLKNAFDVSYTRTVVFAILGVNSLMHAFSLRSFSRPLWRLNIFGNFYLIGAVGISLLLLLVAIYWPPLQAILSTVSLNIEVWLLIISVGIIGTAMIEFVKYFWGEAEKLDKN